MPVLGLNRYVIALLSNYFDFYCYRAIILKIWDNSEFFGFRPENGRKSSITTIFGSKSLFYGMVINFYCYHTTILKIWDDSEFIDFRPKNGPK